MVYTIYEVRWLTEKDKKRHIQVGLKIAYYRKMIGLTQEQFAERINITSGYLSQVETPSIVQPVSLRTLFAVADLCKIPPYKLLIFDEDINEK